MYFKILKENLKHYNMQYHLGLNVNYEETLYNNKCGHGLFFADKNYIMNFASYGTKIAVVELPENEKISECENKYKAHRIIIKEIRDLWTVETFEWLEKLGVNFYISNGYIFRHACRNGHLDVAQWLYNQGNVNIHEYNDDETFRLTCKYGHLNVAQWLYNLGDINIHKYNDEAFRCACRNGHLDVAQWLYNQGNVNIHECNNDAFRSTCENGHLNVAQWLYNLGDVNIHEYDNDTFRSACKNGYLNIAQWLYNLGDIDIHKYKYKYEVYYRSSGEVRKWLETLENWY